MTEAGRPAEAAETGASIYAVTPQAGERPVVLTYDDGPEPGGTDEVLRVLAEHGATATFFVLLSRTRRYPGLLAEVLAAGHEVGLHGVDHRPLPSFGATEARNRTAAGKAELEDALAAPVRWFRPPYGRQTWSTWRAVRAAGLEAVLWGPSTLDWCEVPTADRLAGLRHAGRGSIVLAHDGFAGPLDGVDDGPPPVLDRGDLIRQVLRDLDDRGLTARSLGAVLAAADPVRTVSFRR
jgi:peptidoglycan/xylan/chitin deacetylase (PgdA/CDA1 family)